MEDLQQARTLTGVKFQYSGSLLQGLIIYRTHSAFTSSRAIIELIKLVIQSKSPILMGANRDNPNPYSIGRVLLNKGHSPQHLSYIIPLLIEDGFCTVDSKRPFMITKT